MNLHFKKVKVELIPKSTRRLFHFVHKQRYIVFVLECFAGLFDRILKEAPK